MITTIEETLSYILNAHSGQLYGTVPYVYHSIAVSNELLKYGFDAIHYKDYHILALIHDLIEDCEAKGFTREVIAKDFGQSIADDVWRLSKDKLTSEGEKISRKAGLADYLKKVSGSERAVIIKCCDRSANVKSCITEKNTSLFKMYVGEHPKFVEAFKSFEKVKPILISLEDYLE